MARDKKGQLLSFLDKRAFDPVIRAREEGRSESEKKALKDMKDATIKEKERFHQYGSAEEIALNFKRDLHSRAARPVNSGLKRLGLPQLADLKNEFEELCERLKVAA